MLDFPKSVSLCALLFLTAVPAFAQELTLADTVNAACEFHPDIYTASLQLREANEQVNVAKATALPRINSLTEAGIADDVELIDSAIRDSRPVSTQLSFDQPVYLGGRARAAINGARFELQSERFVSESQILNVQLTAVEAHISLAQSQDVLRVRQQNLSTLEKRRKDAERRFELGGGTKSDIVQAEARIARGEAEIIAAERDIARAQANLYQATGVTDVGELSLPALPRVSPNLQAALELAGRVNPQIGSSNALIDAAQQGIKTAQGNRSPEIRLLGDLSVQRDTVFNGFERDEGSVRLRMTIPLFAGGALAAQERSSYHSRNRAAYDRNRVIYRVRENVMIAWSRFQASKSLISVNNELVRVAELAAIAVEKEAEAGFRPNLDILDSQQELLEARLALTGAQYENVLSAYALLGAIGQLDNDRYLKCQNLLPSFEKVPRYKIVETIDTIIPGIDIKVPEEREKRGPRSRR